jgi:hypothetical protein
MGVVWAYQPDRGDVLTEAVIRKESPFMIKRTRVYLPRHLAGRVRSQEGVFTVHKFVTGKDRFVPMEQNRQHSRKLSKIMIPQEAFPSIRFDLQRCGIHAGLLFPDIVGLAESIRAKHILLGDERSFYSKTKK